MKIFTFLVQKNQTLKKLFSISYNSQKKNYGTVLAQKAQIRQSGMQAIQEAV